MVEGTALCDAKEVLKGEPCRFAETGQLRNVWTEGKLAADARWYRGCKAGNTLIGSDAALVGDRYV